MSINPDQLRTRIAASRSDYNLCACWSCNATLTSADVEAERCTNCGATIESSEARPTPCPDCNHDAHEPDKCKHDNCGDSEVSHSDVVSDYDISQVVTFQNFGKGEATVRKTRHVKARKTGERIG